MLLPDVGRRVLFKARGLLHLYSRDFEALSNMARQSKGHVGPGEAGEEVPHLQDFNSGTSADLVGDKELLKRQRVHLGEGLGEKGGERGEERRATQSENRREEERRKRKLLFTRPMTQECGGGGADEQSLKQIKRPLGAPCAPPSSYFFSSSSHSLSLPWDC